MTVSISRLTTDEIQELISQKIGPTLTVSDLAKFKRAMLGTTCVWGGALDGDIRCIWGLVPPTLISEEAYLWLHVIEPVGDHEFVFVRHSQRAIEEALKRFPTIVGHCEVGADRSIRWIKWLGGVFGEPDGKFIPFVIKA
jgi:hypothetical protein